MAYDKTKPLKTDNFDTGVLSAIRANFLAAILFSETATATITGTPDTGHKRYNNTSHYFEYYTGSAWAEMVLDYVKLNGTGATGTGWTISITGSSASCTGNAATATNVAWSGVTGAPAITGLTADTAATANTVVRRDASAFIFGAYFNQSSGNSENPTGVPQFIVNNGTDGYFRKASLDYVGSQMNALQAAQLRAGGSRAGTAMTFNWSGTGGQPSWLWGSNDGVSHQVYNPSNFNVATAVSATSVTGTSSNGYGTRTVSASAPSGGADGDVWYQT